MIKCFSTPNHILQLNRDNFIAEDVRSGLGTPMHFSACQGSTLLLGSSRVVSLELSCGLSCRTSSLSLVLELRGVSSDLSRLCWRYHGARSPYEGRASTATQCGPGPIPFFCQLAQMHICLMCSRGQLFYWLLFRWFRRFPKFFRRYEFQIMMHAKIVTYWKDILFQIAVWFDGCLRLVINSKGQVSPAWV